MCRHLDVNVADFSHFLLSEVEVPVLSNIVVWTFRKFDGLLFLIGSESNVDVLEVLQNIRIQVNNYHTARYTTVVMCNERAVHSSVKRELSSITFSKVGKASLISTYSCCSSVRSVPCVLDLNL